MCLSFYFAPGKDLDQTWGSHLSKMKTDGLLVNRFQIDFSVQVLTQYCSNGQFGVVFSISIVIWAAIGGRGSLLWAMMGAFIVQGAQSYLGDEFLNAWLLILGFFFIIVVRFLPNGLASLWEMLLGSFSSSNSVSNADTRES